MKELEIEDTSIAEEKIVEELRGVEEKIREK
jgi:hypothetical protein